MEGPTKKKLAKQQNIKTKRVKVKIDGIKKDLEFIS